MLGSLFPFFSKKWVKNKKCIKKLEKASFNKAKITKTIKIFNKLNISVKKNYQFYLMKKKDRILFLLSLKNKNNNLQKSEYLNSLFGSKKKKKEEYLKKK